MKPKVLWIEDGALIEASQFVGPVYTSGKYDLTIALDISEGVRQLMNSEFDAIIVDIRIPPGDDKKWIKFYSQSAFNKIQARLGRLLLYSLLIPSEAKVPIENIPQWIEPNKFGVLTVESRDELEADLEKLGIKVYRQKTAVMPVTVLLELIEEIINLRKIQHKDPS